jgi:hypothetical protein
VCVTELSFFCHEWRCVRHCGCQNPSCKRVLRRIDFGVATADGEHLAVQEPRCRVGDRLQKTSGNRLGVGGRVVQSAVGGGECSAAIRNYVSRKQYFSIAKQSERTVAD